jgi:hypothetical protein
MTRSLHTRAKWAAPLVAVFCLAIPAQAQDGKYLPDGCTVVYSVDMIAFMKSKAYQAAKTKTSAFDEEIQKVLGERIGVAADNITRMSAGVASAAAGGTENVIIISTIKPISAAAIKAAKKPFDYQKDFTHKEEKIGAYTVFVEYYRFQFNPKDKPGELEAGQAFCVVEDKVVLHGGRQLLKKVLERNKMPTLSPHMESALKQVGFKDGLMLVLDYPGMPERERKSMLTEIGRLIPGAAEIAPNVQAFAMRANGQDKVKLSATLFCKDAASAAEAKKVADGGIVAIKALIKDDPEQPADLRAAMKEVRSFLDAIKTSSKGAQANADATVEAATVVSVIEALLVPKSSKKEFKDKK